jgi:hypothetical protein
LSEQVIDYLVSFVEGRRDAPASDFDGVAELLERARGGVPEQGRPLAELLDFVAAATAKGHDTTGDGWLAYVPGGGIFTSALGEFIARATNRFVGVWEPAPVLAQIEATVIRGLKPCLVVASAGTVNTGAVDELAELTAVAHEAGCWLHVDAAYGGFFQLTERGRQRLAGIELADSIALDPHKGMFLPYGTGVLLVREGRRLRVAHEVHGAYLQDLAPEDELPNFADYSTELSRDARGLRVWMPLMLHGLGAFREALDEKLDLAEYLYKELKALPRIEVP